MSSQEGPKIGKSLWRGLNRTIVILCLLASAAVVAGYLVPLAVRATYKSQINYVEGYFLYEEARASAGQLYAAPGYVVDSYPPLFSCLINGLSHFTRNPMMTGRVVAAIGLGLAAVLLGAIVFTMTRDWAAAVLGFLLLLVAIARYASDYVGAHDATLVADAILLAGVLVFFAGSTPRFTIAAAILVATALFFKHSALSFPAAISLVLAMKDRRRFWLWIGCLLGVAAIWFAFCYLTQGHYMIENLLAPRTKKSIIVTAAVFMKVLNTSLLPLIAGGIWLILDRENPYRPYVATAIALATFYGLSVTRYEGVWVNHWFDLSMAVSLGACLAWANLRDRWLHAGWPRPWVLGLFPMIMLAGNALTMPYEIVSLAESRKAWAAEQSVFQAGVEYLRDRQGAAICEDPLLCYLAGKPRDYDPYNARQRMLLVSGGSDAIVEALKTHRYQTVQLDAELDDPIRPVNRPRFTPVFMQALLENYRIGRRDAARVFFIPNN